MYMIMSSTFELEHVGPKFLIYFEIAFNIQTWNYYHQIIAFYIQKSDTFSCLSYSIY